MAFNGTPPVGDDELFLENNPGASLLSGCLRNPLETLKTIASIPLALLVVAGQTLKERILQNNGPQDY